MTLILILFLLPLSALGHSKLLPFSTYNPCNGVIKGFVPDPTDDTCATYWSCVDGDGVKQTCPVGKVFDRLLNACVDGTDYECPPPVCGPNSKGVTPIPYPNECGRYFLCLEGGLLVEQPCGPGLVYDFIDKGCNVPEKANCIVCPAEEQPKLVYYPDKKNCQGYYLCLNGEYRHRTCPEGLHFNDTTNNCQFEEEVACKYREYETTLPEVPPCVGEECPCVGEECPCVGEECPCVGEECPCVGEECPCVGEECPERKRK